MATNPPSVPAAQNVQVSPFQMPYSPVTTGQYLGFSDQQFSQALSQQQSLWNAELMNMRPFTSAMSELNTEFAPAFAAAQVSTEQEFAPQMASLYQSIMQGANPQFMPLYNELGSQLMGNLQQGMEMGPALTREMEQAIRAGQTARGNVMGNAPLAQEAFGMGQAALNLYNQRLGQAQNFLNSKQPSDMWGNIRATTQTYQPINAPVQQATWMNPGVAPDVFGTVANSQSAYNATAASAYGSYVSGQVGAAQVNNQSAFDRYSAQFDQFLYRQSVNQGLYSTPSAGGGSGLAGAAIGAGASAVGMAASAAISAICWVARKVMPDRWREFRRFLFTKAPEEFRQRYIRYGRRLAETMSESDILRIREAMERILACQQF